MKVFRNATAILGIVATAGIAFSASAAPVDNDNGDGFSIQSDGEIALADYSLSVGNAKAKVGSSTTLNVTVTAGDGFKANDQYPNKIKNITVSDVDAPASVSGSASGKTISFSITVTPQAKGSHSLSGQIKFSVCNDSQCKMKKATLSATVTGT